MTASTFFKCLFVVVAFCLSMIALGIYAEQFKTALWVIGGVIVMAVLTESK